MSVEDDRLRAVEERAEAVGPLLAKMLDSGGGRVAPLPEEDDPESFAEQLVRAQLVRAIYGEGWKERRCPDSSVLPTFPAS
jgi:hypothetical protein